MQCTDDSDDMALSEEEVQLRKEAVAWFIRLQNKNLSQEDRHAFEAWQVQSSQHARMYRKVSAVWESPELNAAAAVAAGSGSSWFKAKAVLSLRWPVLTVVCLVVVVVLAGQFDVVTRWRSDYRTEAGERRTVELPDGSTATLNTQSAIVLAFDDEVRRVRLLKGEVFFNVQQDAARPFLVESEETAVRAVGTAFVVRAESSGDRVTVLDGAVEVDSKAKTASPVVVTAGLQIQAEQDRLGRPQAVDAPTASAWLWGRLVVQGLPFALVLEELRRYHPGNIMLLNQPAGRIEVTGTYNIDDPVGALALLVKTLPLSAISLTDRLIILF